MIFIFIFCFLHFDWMGGLPMRCSYGSQYLNCTTTLICLVERSRIFWSIFKIGREKRRKKSKYLSHLGLDNSHLHEVVVFSSQIFVALWSSSLLSALYTLIRRSSESKIFFSKYISLFGISANSARGNTSWGDLECNEYMVSSGYNFK